VARAVENQNQKITFEALPKARIRSRNVLVTYVISMSYLLPPWKHPFSKKYKGSEAAATLYKPIAEVIVIIYVHIYVGVIDI
jgi:hypothetical protein